MELEQELTDVFRKALRTAGFIGGPMVEEFEKAFAAFCDASHSVAVSSGTDALRFALMASGVKPGDVVVTVPHTFIATTEAISQAGALPEFVDIDEQTYNMDPAKLQEYLEKQCTSDNAGKLISRRSGRPVTAVVPVHLYGQMADMDRHPRAGGEAIGLVVIEDACQAHGAEYFSRKHNRWMKAGSMGRAAAFSFYPGKNLGACGEAGAATTNDAAIAKTHEDAAGSWPGHEVLSRRRRLQRPPGRDSGRPAAREAASPGKVERSAPRTRRGIQAPAEVCRRQPWFRPTSPHGRARSITCTWFAPPIAKA